MNLSDFRKAIEKAIWERCVISIIKQKNEPYNKIERFEKAFEINIEKLKGKFSEYHGFHGLKASKKMQIDFLVSETNHSETIDLYKKYGDTGLHHTTIETLYRLYSTLYPNRPNIFTFFMIGEVNPFESIAAEKNHVADYLENCPFYPNLCKNQSSLLRNEADKWNELSQFYKVFLRRGIYLTTYRAELILDNMEKIAKKIIGIEETIIDEAS